MTHSLGWDSLEKRRYVDSVTLMYKVVHNLVLIPLPNSVQSSYSRTRANHPYIKSSYSRTVYAHICKFKCIQVFFFPKGNSPLEQPA